MSLPNINENTWDYQLNVGSSEWNKEHEAEGKLDEGKLGKTETILLLKTYE